MIITTDFYSYIKEANLNEIIENREYFLKEVIDVAESEAKQYTNIYYDETCLYPNLDELQLTSTYIPGELFTYSNNIYTTYATFSIADYGSVSNMLDNNSIKLEDNRNKYLKMVLVDICLYHIHSRISPHQIPELRVLRYDQAIDKLKNISRGLHGSLPQTCRVRDEDDNSISDFIYTMDPQLNNKW